MSNRKSMPGGSVSGCVSMMKRRRWRKPRDPGAYCAAIADRMEPGWRRKNPSDPQRELAHLLALLRASYMTYRTAHWTAHGDDYYANHLLLQRIYEGTEKQIDSLGERIVGYYGINSVSLDSQSDIIRFWMERFSIDFDPLKSSLLAAKEIQEQIVRASRSLGSVPPLGIDDLLASFASEKDEHVYLLTQATMARNPAPRRRRLENP